MSKNRADFEQLLRALHANNVKFVVIGGLAAIYHGSARVTFDLDICYSRTPENLDALSKTLLPLGLTITSGR